MPCYHGPAGISAATNTTNSRYMIPFRFVNLTELGVKRILNPVVEKYQNQIEY